MISDGTFRKKHDAMKIEDIETGQLYAFTLNPNDSIGKNELLTAYCTKHQKALRDILDEVRLSIYPEISPTGRVHFHGTIQINNLYSWARSVGGLLHLYTFCMKPISDDESVKEKGAYKSWFEYCIKQQSFIKKHAGQYYPMVVEISKDRLDMAVEKIRRETNSCVKNRIVRDLSDYLESS